MRWATLIFPWLPWPQPRISESERQPVANGAELLTVFSSLPDNAGEVPLVSVLRDTLGDNDPR